MQPLPANARSIRSRQSSPSMCAQFVTSWQKPSSLRSPATLEMMRRAIPSPPNRLSRKRKLASGEITNGGIRDDQVEASAAYRLEQIAFEALDFGAV